MRSEQGDDLPLGERLRVPFCYFCNIREKAVNSALQIPLKTPIKIDTPIRTDTPTPINFDRSTPIKSDTR